MRCKGASFLATGPLKYFEAIGFASGPITTTNNYIRMKTVAIVRANGVHWSGGSEVADGAEGSSEACSGSDRSDGSLDFVFRLRFTIANASLQLILHR